LAKVLVVDDDRIVSDMYRLALSRAGHEVVVANDGAAGLQAATTDGPDIVFLDVRMPKMDGIEVLRNLMADDATRNLPVVMLSNYDDPRLVRSSLSLGAKEYLVKAGTNPAELGQIVSRWVSRPK
jgi:CheY-like chemotaxis protein